MRVLPIRAVGQGRPRAPQTARALAGCVKRAIIALHSAGDVKKAPAKRGQFLVERDRWGLLYPAQVRTRKSLAEIIRKLSVT
jgi:hypothetical protein